MKAVVFDGKEHPVDSKDIAFQTAGREVFKLAFKAANPVLLEPTVELEIHIPVESVKAEFDKAYVTLGKRAHVKGFRPGKVPRAVLAHLFSGRVYQDVAQKLVDETLDKAISEQQVQPLSQPAIAPMHMAMWSLRSTPISAIA